MCVSYWSDCLFSLPPSWTVLLLDCITCSAPVWLSLVAWWSFLASSEIPVRLSIPQPFHIPLTHPHPPSSLLMMVTKPFLFPDCSASVHKGCRDSLPACAKVKMKVHIPLACHFFSILSLTTENYLICLSVSLTSCPSNSIQFQTQVLLLQSWWETNVSFLAKHHHQLQFNIQKSSRFCDYIYIYIYEILLLIVSTYCSVWIRYRTTGWFLMNSPDF